LCRANLSRTDRTLSVERSNIVPSNEFVARLVADAVQVLLVLGYQREIAQVAILNSSIKEV
jgi:hypothetical protein